MIDLHRVASLRYDCKRQRSSLEAEGKTDLKPLFLLNFQFQWMWSSLDLEK